MSVWTTRATGGAHGLDRAEVLRALGLLIDPSQTFELRGVSPGAGAHSRICKGQDLPAAVEAAWELSDHPGLYWTLNPLRHDMTGSASVKDVISRRWLLFDIDTQRQDKDSSSTEQEKINSSKVVGQILDFLSELGWSHAVVVDSGNGWHLLYRIDLPNDKLSHQLVKAVIAEVGRRFDTNAAKIDKAVHDASRISKLPGSWVRKGIESPERPHRIARLVYIPEDVRIVTVEQLHELAQAGKVDPPSLSPWRKTATNGHGLDAYCRSAIERECGRVCMAAQGERNTSLNIAAFCLGTMAAWPEMIGMNPQASLTQAAQQAGLEDWEIKTTVRSGWDAGATKPRERPVEPHANGVAKTVPCDPNEMLTEGLDEIQPEKVDWLYENRVAPGFISIFAGRTGYGKSFVVCDLVAALSRGEMLPYSNLIQTPTRTLFISEDSPRKVLAPRLIELRAVRPMIRFMTFKAMGKYTISDTAMLHRAYQECGSPRLLVIDPPSKFLGGIDEHKNAEVSHMLHILVTWLEEFNVACILIMHINKQIGKGLDAVERIVGSVAWGASARMTVAFVRDPDNADQMICGGTKNNLGPHADTLAYRIVKTDTFAKVEWIGKTDTNMEDAMNHVKKKSRGVVATEWLEERFRESNEWESEKLKEMAREVGISKNALWSPEVNALPIEKKRRSTADGEIYFVWRSLPGWPPPERAGKRESGKATPEVNEDKHDATFPPY